MLEGLEGRIQELRMCQRKVKNADECNSPFTAHIIADNLIGVFDCHLVLANEEMRLLVQVIRAGGTETSSTLLGLYCQGIASVLGSVRMH